MKRWLTDPQDERFLQFFIYLILTIIILNPVSSLPLQDSRATEAPGGVIYQGRIIKPDATPLEASNVLFTVGIYSADGVCLLYEETHTLNMTGTSGSFALTLGSGVSTGPSYSLKQVFSNASSFTGGGSCSYTPGTGHTRKLKVTFDDGGGPVALQDQVIQSVPFALYASKLEGMGKSDFVQINTSTSSLSQANANSLFQTSTYNELIALAGGTSTQFAKASDLPVTSGVLNLSGAGQGVRVLDTPPGGSYAVNKNYSDAYVGGRAVDSTNFSGLSNGESIQWDTTANSGLGGWVRYTPVSSSGFVVKGGQTGAVSLGSTDANSLSMLTNGATRMTLDSSGNVGIGTPNPNSSLEIFHATDPRIRLTTGGSNTTSIYQNSATNLIIENHYNNLSTEGNIQMVTGGFGGAQPILTLESKGNAGIGVWDTTPDAYLEITEDPITGTSDYLMISSTEAANGDILIVNQAGNVGIGTTNPNSKLEVQGPIVSSAADVPTGASVDLSASNTITLNSVGGSTITLSNMVHGGTYTLVIKDTTARTYTFSGCNTSKFKPINGSTQTGTWSVYTLLTLYNGATYDCVITWATGYQ